jgi:NAD(P)-dependent dehydrogenase (short-subunit alcohol dehydrogenase family)
MPDRQNRTWTPDDIGDQRGRTALITGANTGLGFATASALARHAAAVILACRDPARAEAAAARINADVPDARVTTVQLDLASLASIRAAATAVRADHPTLDLLINNAGLIHPRRARTEDGHELHLGTNHLGHFALTALLLDRLLPVAGSRVVTVSSNAHRNARIHFDDLQLDHEYSLTNAYGQSKLANLLFTRELQRRLTAAGAGTVSVAAHPGNAHTDVARHMPALVRLAFSPRLRPLNRWLMQPAAAGALPVLRAAVDPTARGGDYYGPGGAFGFTGPPIRVPFGRPAQNTDTQQRLWDESERLTGITYQFTGATR